MTYQITTSYPDGRTETRDATPEEVAQREADIAAAEAQQAEEQARVEAYQAAAAGAVAKFTELGFSDDQIAVVLGHSVEQVQATR